MVLLRTGRVAALPHSPQRPGWHLVLLRGLIAGVVVAGVAAAAGARSDRRRSRLRLPDDDAARAVGAAAHYGAEFALATMARVPAGIPIYAGFCLALHLAAGSLPALAAWALAVAAAAALALLRARLGQPRARGIARAAGKRRL